ncbi:twin-arginine translocation signal domain-containing protein, partial [Acinetobacter baumannii]
MTDGFGRSRMLSRRNALKGLGAAAVA